MATNYRCKNGDPVCDEDWRHLSGHTKDKQFTPEYEDITEGEEGSLVNNYDECAKNPGHKSFIRVSDFNLHHLPEEYRSQQNFDSILRRCDLTVRIRVSYTSLQRPDTFSDSKAPYPARNCRGKYRRVRYGTGIVVRVCYDRVITTHDCVCQLCQASGKPEKKFLLLIVRTATHVIYDDSEAKMSKFDCFYDGDKEDSTTVLYGVCMIRHLLKDDRFSRSDVCEVMCATHETGILPRLTNLSWPPLRPISENRLSSAELSWEVIVSHPHGWSKRITMGNINYVTVPIIPCYKTDVPITFKSGTSCRLHVEPNSSEQPEHTSTSSNDSVKSFMAILIKYASNQTHKPKPEIEGNVEFINAKQIPLVLPFNENLFLEVLTLNTNHLKLAFLNLLPVFVNAQEEIGLKAWSHFGGQSYLTGFAQDEMYHPGADTTEEDMAIRALKEPFLGFDAPIPLLQDQAFLHPQDVIVQTFIDVVTQYKKEYASDTFLVSRRKFDSVVKVDCKNTTIAKSNDLQKSSAAKEVNPEVKREESIEISKENKAHVYSVGNKTKKEKSQFILNIFTDWATKIIRSCFSELELADRGVVLIAQSTLSRVEMIIQTIFFDSTNNIIKSDQNPTMSNDAHLHCENEIRLPFGMSFILPQDADYAFRYTRGKSGWFVFPKDTKCILPHGTITDLPNEIEFKNESLVPRLCYLTYDIDTCPCSSGAAVVCDWLQNADMTYFPHSGSLNDLKKNRSGILQTIPLSKLSDISENLAQFRKKLDED